MLRNGGSDLPRLRETAARPVRTAVAQAVAADVHL
jgi:hypothetical protein